MPQVTIETISVITLQLTEAEALWLKAYLQNASDEEAIPDRLRREALWTALHEAGVKS